MMKYVVCAASDDDRQYLASLRVDQGGSDGVQTSCTRLDLLAVLCLVLIICLVLAVARRHAAVRFAHADRLDIPC